MPRLQAQKALEDGAWRTADELYDLTLLATGSKDVAEKAWLKRRHDELRSGQVPET